MIAIQSIRPTGFRTNGQENFQVLETGNSGEFPDYREPKARI